MLYWDPTYLILLPALIISAWAQMRIQSVYHQASQLAASCGATAAQVARQILDGAGLYQVQIEPAPGQGLSDHYDPRADVLRLSALNFSSASIAALGVAAHEAGHAIQKHEGYAPMSVRAVILPVANFGQMASWPLLLIGLIFGSSTLAMLGVYLFSAVLLFQLVTLPVEFNASARAITLLDQMNILQPEELEQAKKVLRAAAMTYVAAAFTALLQLLRLFTLANRGNRRD